MLQLLKVRGHSMHPIIRDGDFVVTARVPFPSGKIRAGDKVVFHQPGYGLMIKQVHKVHNAGKAFDLRGTQIDSTDSRNFGLVPLEHISAKVIWHIQKE